MALFARVARVFRLKAPQQPALTNNTGSLGETCPDSRATGEEMFEILTKEEAI